MRENFDWVCPFCGTATTITPPNHSHSHDEIDTDRSKLGDCFLEHEAIACPNRNCRELYLAVHLRRQVRIEKGSGGTNRVTKRIPGESWVLRPESIAKPQPEYIPEAIRKTYREACRIVSLSPMASAALSRRCLQGMIRNFWRVTDKPNLFQEIEAIKDKVEPSTWEAIHVVREKGNIGAHMEKTVN